jgi:hypothetical protein
MNATTITIGPIRIGDIGYYEELQARDNARFVAIWELIHIQQALGNNWTEPVYKLRNELNNLRIQTPNS